jgi:hypothetical protein
MESSNKQPKQKCTIGKKRLLRAIYAVPSSILFEEQQSDAGDDDEALFIDVIRNLVAKTEDGHKCNDDNVAEAMVTQVIEKEENNRHGTNT